MDTREALLNAIRRNYHDIVEAIEDGLANERDAFIWEKISEAVEEYARIIDQNSEVIPQAEYNVLLQNIQLIRTDVQLEYQSAVELSHQGRPALVHTVHTGQRGRPRIEINPDFLEYASTQSRRTRTGLARYFNVGRSTLVRRQQELGIAHHSITPQSAPPGPSHDTPPPTDAPEAGPALNPGTHDDLLDPIEPLPETIPEPGIHPPDGPANVLTDVDLDALILRLRSHFRRAGITMLDGMLHRLGYQVPRERVRQSLKRIDPVHRVFQRIQIRRRVYHVPGPNSLWHHDGQHGLIRWGIVIHGFIDGYSRMITALRASNNNSGQTVLELFLAAAAVYGVPSRVRGDHGIENILIAAMMEELRGVGRGSYIWGRSVHNVRIERLWVDITTQLGSIWREQFTILEVSYGLNHLNVCHRWLLHHLFLASINAQLSFFAETWNKHTLQMRRGAGPNRTPEDMFVFDMFVHGVRGEELLSPEELEVFGVDWEALGDDAILESLRARNTPGEMGWTSWIGHSGPPEQLGGVELDPPEIPFDSVTGLTLLDDAIIGWQEAQVAAGMEVGVVQIWVFALSYMRNEYPMLF